MRNEGVYDIVIPKLTARRHPSCIKLRHFDGNIIDYTYSSIVITSLAVQYTWL